MAHACNAHVRLDKILLMTTTRFVQPDISSNINVHKETYLGQPRNDNVVRGVFADGKIGILGVKQIVHLQCSVDAIGDIRGFN